MQREHKVPQTFRQDIEFRRAREACRPIVLVVAGYFVPSFKAGGIPRSVANLVTHLHQDLDFRVITRDRDLGDDKPHSGVRLDEWQKVGNALVYYLSPHGQSIKNVRRIMSETPHDLLYLNSFFDPLTIRALLVTKFGRLCVRPILLAPRGELSPQSLRQKSFKKASYITLARILTLFKGVTWHAATEVESGDIRKTLKVHREAIQVALDLPTQVDSDLTGTHSCKGEAIANVSLRIAFLSRIAPQKNLAYALKVLSNIRSTVSFDIFGPIENAKYWAHCQELLLTLPKRVTARFCGSIYPSQVMQTLARYDLLFLPSKSESYGHVLVEALTVGTPVLTTTNTPWRDLEARGLGWDLPLERPERFALAIDDLSQVSPNQREGRRLSIRSYMRNLLSDPLVLESNQRLFRSALARAL